VILYGNDITNWDEHRIARAGASLMPTCACRKSNPDIFVMQSAEYRAAKNTPALFTVRDSGASLSKAKCVRISL
jgi:hypothetical protein